MRPIVLGILLAGVVPAASAQSAASPAPCAGPEHRQFDFWLGDWDVANPTGKAAGSSRVESILGGCVVLENWTSATPPAAGKSFNVYNAQTAQWEQYWVDNGGTRLHLVGGLVGGAMVLRGQQDKPNAQTGLTQRERITWTPNPDGSVRQLWETSNDDGKTWAVSFDGLYRRADAPGG